MTKKCEVCKGDKTGNHWKRCNDCYKCDTCETDENLCTYVDGIWCAACRAYIIQQRIENFFGDTGYQENITCPYCGNVETDSWERSDDSDDIDCDDCENTFSFERHVEIAYSTKKIGSSKMAILTEEMENV